MDPCGTAFLTSDEEEVVHAKPKPTPKSMPAAAATPCGRAKATSLGMGEVFMTSDEDEVPLAKAEPVAKKESAAVMKRPAGNGLAGARAKKSTLVATDANDGREMPRNSGAFAYAKWCVELLSPEDADHLSMLPPLRVGSMCSGMCTEALAFKAIQMAMLNRLGKFPDVTIEFVVENCQAKRKILKRFLPTALVLCEIGDLANKVVEDSDGNQRDQPTCDWLIGGLSCKCLSQLNSNPQPLLGDGPTGVSVRGMLTYIESLTFECRPQVVTIEEVTELLKVRQCESEQRASIQILTDRMDIFGYSCTWEVHCSVDFFLPHQRDRVWPLFFKRGSICATIGMHEGAAAKLRDAHTKMAQFRTGGKFESLETILDKLGGDASRHVKVLANRQPISPETEAANKKCMDANGVTAADMDRVQQLQEMLTDLTPRAKQTFVLKLVSEAKKKSWKWDSDMLVATVSQSVSYMKIRKDVFPNLTPGDVFVFLRGGIPAVASGRLCMQMQGIHDEELLFMDLTDTSDEMLRNLAGNAFTANVCVASLLATMLALFSAH